MALPADVQEKWRRNTTTKKEEDGAADGGEEELLSLESALFSV